MMKSFDLKYINGKAYRTTVLIILLGVLIVFGLFFIEWVARYGGVGIIVPLIVIGIILVFIKRYFRTEARVDITEDELILVRKQDFKRIGLKEIALIRHRINMADDYVHIFRAGGTKPAIRFSTFNQSATVRAIFIELEQRLSLVKSTTKAGWDEYVNKEVAQNDGPSIARIRSQKDPNKQAFKYIAIFGFILLFVVPFIFMIVNKSEEGYQISREEVTYNGVALPLNMEQYKWVGSSIVKDSNRVYFYGEPVEWADAPTFENISGVFYRDKNGIYQEKLNFFTKNKLIPLKGDFDEDTFTSVGGGNTFFKDKDHVYYFNFNLGSGKNPLRRLNIEGIDAPSFEALDQGYLWYRDKNHVYFGNWSDFRVCPEIDRETFELLTYQVSKDKNNVYYLTRFLNSEDKSATERDNYAVLKGAHAPSFVMIDRETFEDRNTTWTIESPEERGTQVRHRKDLE